MWKNTSLVSSKSFRFAPKASKRIPSFYSNRFVLNGLGAPLVSEDFGSMGTMGFNLGEEFNKLLDAGIKSAQTAVTKAVTTTVQKTILKLTGADGKVASVALTPAQVEQYKKDGSLPPELLPKDFVLPPKSFMQEYGKILTYAGIGIGSLVAIAIIANVMKKKKD
jgi:hypothetical protein